LPRKLIFQVLVEVLVMYTNQFIGLMLYKHVD